MASRTEDVGEELREQRGRTAAQNNIGTYEVIRIDCIHYLTQAPALLAFE